MEMNFRHKPRAGRAAGPETALVCAAVLLSGCGTSDHQMATMVPAATFAAEAPGQGATAAADYRIGPLDELEVSVPHVAEIGSGSQAMEVQVTASGEIALPLVGKLVASGLTAEQLRQAIIKRLDQYVKDPEVAIFIKKYASQRVTVEGEVNQAGIFPIEGKTSLLQALALAHGTSQNANFKSVAIYRTINGQRVAAVYDLKAIRTGRSPDPEVIGNDVVEVNSSRSKTFFHDAIAASPLLLFARP
jgi:polysaccharide export outer membrane protein